MGHRTNGYMSRNNALLYEMERTHAVQERDSITGSSIKTENKPFCLEEASCFVQREEIRETKGYPVNFSVILVSQLMKANFVLRAEAEQYSICTDL